MPTKLPSASSLDSKVFASDPVLEALEAPNLAAKATFDRAAAATLLLLCSPILLVVMLLVKLTSRGPALYSQTRLGLGGRPFTIHKVRTMRVDCERLSGVCWSPRHDPRVTRLGRWLRASHLDELPQLWNVLRGEMSLVGPRPERPEFLEDLQAAIPEYPRRMEVRPGITGLAQVRLPPDLDLDDVRRKVVHDLLYIERMDPWLDLRILLATVATVAGVRFGVVNVLLRLPVSRPADKAMRAAAGPGDSVATARLIRETA